MVPIDLSGKAALVTGGGQGLGAAIAMLVTLLINRRLQRDFNREWTESLRVKRQQPLGEIELARRAQGLKRPMVRAEGVEPPTPAV